ncbi:hypothetical protein OPU71_19685, partial [Niveibacterium sp. 24ML]|uniref:hypothetical protein n=1 Tax=Niveibacterium sp. 24ML TaxID=2985512 RepID=UPI0022703AAF
RWVLPAMFLHHAHRALTNLRRELVRLLHGSIFSRVGASSKPGAIQCQLAASAASHPKTSAICSRLEAVSTGFGSPTGLRPLADIQVIVRGQQANVSFEIPRPLASAPKESFAFLPSSRW